MQNKKEKERVLIKDLVKYSEQIGLSAIPRIVFCPQDWDEQYHPKHKTKRDRWMGLSCRDLNLIMVNLDYQGPVHSKEYYGTKNNRYYKIIPKKWGIHEARQTLVHELIHIRWKMKHGYEFAKRIDDILKGQRFDMIEEK